MAENTAILEPKPRTFLPAAFTIIDWATLEPYLEELKSRNLQTAAELEQWLLDRSELESVLAEDMGWRYIRMTSNTQDEAATEAFNYFVNEIEPHIAPYDHALNEKLIASSYLPELDQEKYHIYLRSVQKAIEIFREENIPLNTEITTKQQQYAALTGSMTVTLNGQEMTLPQASDQLKNLDRNIRQEAYLAVQERRWQDKDELNNLYTELISLRHQVAQNAGFPNFRDYMFAALGRFDYTVQDCLDFHKAIRTQVVPLIDVIDRQRQQNLGLPELKPWDLEVDETGKPPLKPFKTGEELLQKTIACFYRLDPFLGDCLVTMKNMNRVDLESRKGKAPGGYNYPLDETGVPFIFMNATSSLRDVVTMLHEGGHAVHNFLTHDLSLGAFKHTPSEVAELASMAMELISMDHWDLFFDNPEDLQRAKKTHLESVLETFSWVATIDQFQHWVYENPNHTLAEREENWLRIFNDFNQHQVNWAGLEKYKPYLWQKQLHLYEVPFYYIEYAMAQLGAIAVWRNYKQNPETALEGYKNALRLGYTKSIGEVYAAAGIQFDFSEAYIKALTDFVQGELDLINS